MKKLVLLLTIPSSLCIATSQFNQDFVHRFGLNSHIYNTPLYFATIRRNEHENSPQQDTRKTRKQRPTTTRRYKK